ncbi:hypothetical protein HAX54_030815 [Datura stramonium]|uniref:Uncharacterized protein n=1 Tax=Datura stramonium TaxID=4076 RepID=A0ABS8VAI5_DATST|nr:hypothetical protein [Datura stramonium]
MLGAITSRSAKPSGSKSEITSVFPAPVNNLEKKWTIPIIVFEEMHMLSLSVAFSNYLYPLVIAKYKGKMDKAPGASPYSRKNSKFETILFPPEMLQWPNRIPGCISLKSGEA